MTEIQLNGHLTYIGIKEDNTKIRIFEARINESDDMVYASVFRYTIIPAEDKIRVRQIQMVFVNDLDNTINLEKQENILKQYLNDQMALHDNPEYLSDVRDKLIDDLGGYCGISFEGNIQNYLQDNNNIILGIPTIIVELLPSDIGFSIIKHTEFKTLGTRQMEIFYNINDPLFSLYYEPFRRLS
jgi:hypothetical protein